MEGQRVTKDTTLGSLIDVVDKPARDWRAGRPRRISFVDYARAAGRETYIIQVEGLGPVATDLAVSVTPAGIELERPAAAGWSAEFDRIDRAAHGYVEWMRWLAATEGPDKGALDDEAYAKACELRRGCYEDVFIAGYLPVHPEHPAVPQRERDRALLEAYEAANPVEGA